MRGGVWMWNGGGLEKTMKQVFLRWLACTCLKHLQSVSSTNEMVKILDMAKR